MAARTSTDRQCTLRPSYEPAVWGPYTWSTLHTMSLAYPVDPTPQHASACRAFVQTIPYMLPCTVCGAHMAQYGAGGDGQRVQRACQSRAHLVQYMTDLHNDVNARSGKPQWDLNTVYSRYAYGYACQ